MFVSFIKSSYFTSHYRCPIPTPIAGKIYIIWTYDTFSRSFWEAEAGHYYYVNESYTDAEGKRQTRRVRKIRWEYAAGRHQAFFDDVLVAAAGSVDEDLLGGIYPYRTGDLTSYDPRFLAGWAAQDYVKEMPDGWPEARSHIDAEIRIACIRQVPGDTHRNLRVRTSYLNRTFKLCLLPVWTASYRFRGQVWPVLINGQSGRVQGRAPISWTKVLLLVGSLLAACALVYALQVGAWG